MRFVRNQAAWAVVSLLLSGVWWLMTHTSGAAPRTASPPPDTSFSSGASSLSLSTPATLSLISGETVRGTITGVQALCPSWSAALTTGGVTVTLPDGRTVHDTEVRTISADPVTLGGLAELVNTTACGDVLTIHAATP